MAGSPGGQPNVFQQSSRGLNAAMGGTAAGMGYRPMMVGAPSAMARGYNAATVGGSSLEPYMNPFTQNVIDTSMGALDRSRNMALNNTGAAASGVGAFGGARHGVAEAETNRAFMDQSGQLAAGLNQANFNTALGASQFDVGQVNQGQQFSANAFNQNQLANAQMRMQARLANQSAGLQGNAQRLGGAAQMGNLSNLGFGMGQSINSNLARQGAQQQAMNQSVFDAARNKFAGFAGSPGQSLQYPLAAIGAAPRGEGTSTTKQQPGLLNIMSALLAVV